MKKRIAKRQGLNRMPSVGSWSKIALALAGLGLIGLLGGCSSQGPTYADGATDPRLGNPDEIPDAVPRVEPRSKYGNMETYVVRGRRYYTKQSSDGHVERGLASWYGPNFHSRKTSSGERYDMYAMTAAHKTLPLPTYARVTNVENGRSAVVKINDRGPFHGPRVIDLSYAAATKLGVVRKGTAMVEIRAIDPARPSSDPGPFLAAQYAGAPAPMLADNASRSSSPALADAGTGTGTRIRISLAGEDDWLEGERIVEGSTSSLSSSFAARPEPVVETPIADDPEPALAARAQTDASRDRAFEAAMAALDAEAERAAVVEAPVVRAPERAGRIAAEIDDRTRFAVATETEAPKVPVAARKGAPKVAAAAKKDSSRVAAPAKKDAPKVAAAAKKDAPRVAAAAKKDAPKVAAAAKKGAPKVAGAAKPETTKVAATGRGVYLQVGAFGDRGNAERLRKRLSPHVAGQVRIQNPAGSGSSLYKVRVGPFGSEGEARKASAKLASLGVGQSKRVVN